MSRRKAMLTTTIIMALMSAVVFFIWRNGRGFGVIEGVFAVYGYIRFAADLCCWLRMPEAQITGGRHG